MAFADILFGFIDGHFRKPFFIRCAEVKSDLLYGCEDDQIICVKFFCKQTAGKVFINNCAGTF